MELMMIIVILFCVLYPSAADDYSNNSDIYIDSRIPDDVKQYISEAVSILAAKHSSDIQALRERIYSQEKRIHILESEQKIHTSIIRELKKEILHVEDEMKICNCEYDKKSYKHEVTDMTESKNSSAGKNGNGVNQGSEQGSSKDYQRRIRRASVESKVAFFATLTSTTDHLGKDQDIVFDHVVTNIGGAYNANHGTFIAPVAGTYVFSVTLCHDVVLISDGTWGHVVVNRAIVAKLRVFDEQSTQTIFVNLEAGDDVSIQNTETGRGFTGDRYSTFGGFLLYENVSKDSIIG